MINSKISSQFVSEHSRKVRKFPGARNKEGAEDSQATVRAGRGQEVARAASWHRDVDTHVPGSARGPTEAGSWDRDFHFEPKPFKASPSEKERNAQHGR